LGCLSILLVLLLACSLLTPLGWGLLFDPGDIVQDTNLARLLRFAYIGLFALVPIVFLLSIWAYDKLSEISPGLKNFLFVGCGALTTLGIVPGSLALSQRPRAAEYALSIELAVVVITVVIEITRSVLSRYKLQHMPLPDSRSYVGCSGPHNVW